MDDELETDVGPSSRRRHGKWSDPEVPHKGWWCVGVEDLGEPDATCEMCEERVIRYVHEMHHVDYPEPLFTGCICAGNMEQDMQAAREREQKVRNKAANRARRRARWLDRTWHRSARGNQYINTDGMNVTIYRGWVDGHGFGWRSTIEDRATGRQLCSRRKYESEDAIKLAAFDAMIQLKEKRGWGR